MRSILLILILTTATQAQSGVVSDRPLKASAANVTSNESTPKDDALIESVTRGDLPGVLAQLARGAGPNTTDDEKTPALCLAVRANRPDITEALLTAHAEVDAVTEDGGTALQVAAGAGHATLVKLLLDHGAAVNKADLHGHTPLIYAAFGALVRSAPAWLATQFFDIDEDDDWLGKVGDDHQLIAELLLKAGAEVNAQARDCGYTALMVAAIGGNVELTKILLTHHANVDVRNGEWNALSLAVDFGSPATLPKDLAELDDDRSKQAMLNFVHLTQPGRQEVAKLLRNARAH